MSTKINSDRFRSQMCIFGVLLKVTSKNSPFSGVVDLESG